MPLYTRFSRTLKELWPDFPVFKIPLHAGFTCPNRDGSKAVGGCVYCDNRSFAPETRGPRKAVEEQIARAKERYRRRAPDARFIAYYQAYSNTYGEPERLREIYDVAANDPDIVGVSIGTRPDCAPEEALDVVETLRTPERRVWVEYGLESAHEETLRWMNRCHTAADFEDAVRRTARRGLPVVAHVILELPGETPEMQRETARFLAGLPVDSVKIHHLYVAPHTALEGMWRRGEVAVPTLAEHAARAADFLEILPEHMSIQRLIGELPGEWCLAPDWKVTKPQALAAVEAELARRGTRQGAKAPGPAVVAG
ncbi:MAG: TIGR01212 family radical SAM protein [Planctomycetes bacterium]|nr:TIGR01212 family radical SAM protein [Planctomycetota bacterium]